MRIKDDTIKKEKFKNISLQELFFVRLQQDYLGFSDWFEKKAKAGEEAYVGRCEEGNIVAFMYLKNEDDIDSEITPELSGRRIKIGTFKVDDDHHTSIGKRLLATALRQFAENDYDFIYVTMFERDYTCGLKNLLNRYGFDFWGQKGEEKVFLKRKPTATTNVYKDFPFVDIENKKKYLLSIFPKYHQKMFGEVDLQTERQFPVEDLTSINNIEKMYFSAAFNANQLKEGDIVVAYRTSDNQGPALYRSVLSSVLTVAEIRNINDFKNEEEYHEYVRGKTVFTKGEIDDFWNTKRYPWIINLTYNFSLKKYPNRKILLDNEVIASDDRIVLHEINTESLKKIMELGCVSENFII